MASAARRWSAVTGLVMLMLASGPLVGPVRAEATSGPAATSQPASRPASAPASRPARARGGPASEPAPAEAPLVSLTDLTGAHTRVVWMQSQADRWGNHFEPTWKLAGYDSADGRGERIILDDTESYFRPMLTGDGQRIVYSDKPNVQVYVVGFDGTGRRKLCAGMALETWRDPVTGKDYAFVQRGTNAGRAFDRNPVYRVNVDDPADEQLSWSASPITYNNFQLSRDGRYVAIEAPWPRCISAELPNGAWRVFGQGCYPSMAPDNSYITWHMNGEHKRLMLFSASGQTWWRLSINTVPGFANRKIHQPRWTNHVRYLVLTGPYPDSEGRGARTAPGDANIYLGRFSPDLRAIEAWAKVSSAGRQCVFADAWIAGGDRADAPPIAEIVPAASQAVGSNWPGSSEGLVFLWDHKLASNKVRDERRDETRGVLVEPHGLATWGRGNAMDVTGGWFEVKEGDARLAEDCAGSNAFTFEAVVTADSTGAQNNGTIAVLKGDLSPAHFMLTQRRGNLTAYLYNRRPGGPAPRGWVDLGPIEAGRPTHVLVTARADQTVAYVNGQRVVLNVDTTNDLRGWPAGKLSFGSGAAAAGKPGWGGLIEAVAVYDRFVPPGEVAQKYKLVQERLARRPAPSPRVVVQAKLVKLAPLPDVNGMGPYRSALVQGEYAVEQVLEGECPAKAIAVAHWGVMDRAAIESFKARQVGQSYRLELEPLEPGSPVGSEFMVAGEIDPGLPLYYARDRLPPDPRTPAQKLRSAIEDSDAAEVVRLVKADPALLQSNVALPGSRRPQTPVDLAADWVAIWRPDSQVVLRELTKLGGACDAWTAARGGLLEEVRAALDKDPALLNAKGPTGHTLLQRASQTSAYSELSQAVADELIRRGAEVDLFTAAHRGELAIVQRLLTADPALARATDPDGVTALMWVVRPVRDSKDYVAIAKLLLDGGAAVSAGDPTCGGMTALHHLGEWGGPEELVDLLVAKGADVNAKDERGRTPLDYADERGERRMAGKLRAVGAQASGNR